MHQNPNHRAPQSRWVGELKNWMSQICWAMWRRTSMAMYRTSQAQWTFRLVVSSRPWKMADLILVTCHDKKIQLPNMKDGIPSSNSQGNSSAIFAKVKGLCNLRVKNVHCTWWINPYENVEKSVSATARDRPKIKRLCSYITPFSGQKNTEKQKQPR